MDLVFVTLASNRLEADIMMATLESEGIGATWRQSSPASTVLVGGTLGPIEILVLREHQARAREFLSVDAPD